MKSKRSQVQSQIFIYIIAIVVVGMILLFGYNAVKNFGKRAEQVALIQFENDMTSSFHTVSTSYGKVEIKRIEVPGEFDTVCFADLDTAIGDLHYNNLEYPVVSESVNSGAEKNLFLKHGIELESFYVGNIVISVPEGIDHSEGFICFKEKQGRVEFKLFGEGNKVLVTTAD